MVDSLLKLVEWLLKLRDVRKERRERLFDRYFKPTYEEAEQVYRDYLKLLTHIKTQLESGVSVRAIVSEMEQARIENKPVRDKLRAVLDHREIDSADITRFEKGIWGVLQGGLSLYEKTWDYNFEPYESALATHF